MSLGESEDGDGDGDGDGDECGLCDCVDTNAQLLTESETKIATTTLGYIAPVRVADSREQGCPACRLTSPLTRPRVSGRRPTVTRVGVILGDLDGLPVRFRCYSREYTSSKSFVDYLYGLGKGKKVKSGHALNKNTYLSPPLVDLWPT